MKQSDGKKNRCSRCKKIGHNSRTCGKLTPPPSRPRPTQPFSRYTESYRIALSSPTLYATNTPQVLQDKNQQYTAEELLTMWRLVGWEYSKKFEKTSDPQNGYTRTWSDFAEGTKNAGAQTLYMVVKNATSNPETSPTVEEWEKFYSTFNTVAHQQLSSLIYNECYPDRYNPSRILHPNQMKVNKVPQQRMNAVIALMETGPDLVKEQLAQIPDLPTGYVMKVLHAPEPNTPVMRGLLRNPTTTPQVLVKIHTILEETSTITPQEKREMEVMLAEHHNLPETLQEKYLTDKSWNDVYQATLKNPSLKPEKIQHIYTTLRTVKKSPNFQPSKGINFNRHGHPDDYIKSILVNPSTPENVIENEVREMSGEEMSANKAYLLARTLTHPNLTSSSLENIYHNNIRGERGIEGRSPSEMLSIVLTGVVKSPHVNTKTLQHIKANPPPVVGYGHYSNPHNKVLMEEVDKELTRHEEKLHKNGRFR